MKTNIPSELVKNRKLIFNLAKNDIRSRFAGSYLGVFWAFIQPLITVFVYWFVFEVAGLKGSMVGEYTFLLFLVTGIVPWFFFSDALNGGMNAFFDYSYLVKKVVFKIDILPFVKILSALFVHLFFVAFSIVLMCLYGYLPNLATLQVLYYILCNVIFVTSLSYLCSSIAIFFRDLGQFVNLIVLQLGMWMTPILWDAATLLGGRPRLLKIMKLNPMYYIVDGFRDAVMLREFNLVNKGIWSLYFWVVTIAIYLFGMYVYKRMKPHFADVL